MDAQGIAVEQLSVCFDDAPPILSDLSLTVNPGEIVAVVGPSGCGKTTLLRVLAGLLPPRSGNVRFFSNRPPGDDHARRQDAANVVDSARESSGVRHAETHTTGSSQGAEGQKDVHWSNSTTPIPSSQADGDRPGVGVVFQEPALLPWRTVWENVQLPLELRRGQSKSQRQESVRRSLHAVHLGEEHWGKLPRELSGGMRMRTSLARALVADPGVLLLDEPFAALDDMLRTRLNELLIELWLQRRRTMVFVTHNLAEAVFLSHRIVLLDQGRVQAELTNRLAWPRRREQRGTAEFAQMYGQASRLLWSAGQED